MFICYLFIGDFQKFTVSGVTFSLKDKLSWCLNKFSQVLLNKMLERGSKENLYNDTEA